MAYNDFTLESALDTLGLKECVTDLYGAVPPPPASSWLQETLRLTYGFWRTSNTEKSRSEGLVAPILTEILIKNKPDVWLHSGRALDVVPAQGLSGECDFILTHSQQSYVIRNPFCTFVQAKEQDVSLGLGPCVAQMYGVRMFNRGKGQSVRKVFGCVTTGEHWHFLKLQANIVTIAPRAFYLSQLDKILGILQSIVDSDDAQGQTP